MENSYWEEQDMGKSISLYHEAKMADMKLPTWILNIRCPFCKKPIPKRSIRNIQLCLNTRNFGEIAVEIICDECKKMDTVYLRTKISGLSQFIDCLSQNESPSEQLVLEEEMIKLNYNNLLEKMYQEKQQARENNVVDKEGNV